MRSDSVDIALTWMVTVDIISFIYYNFIIKMYHYHTNLYNFHKSNYYGILNRIIVLLLDKHISYLRTWFYYDTSDIPDF